MSEDINIGAISEALNGKLDIDGMNSNTTTPVGFNANGTRTVVEVSDKSLIPSWYRVYSDGWCEQGGVTSGTSDAQITVSFLKTFTSTPNILTTRTTNTLTSTNATNFRYDAVQNLGVSSFECWGLYSGYPLHWEASGYIR